MKFYRTDPTGAVFTDCPFRQGIVMRKRAQQPSWVAAVFQNAAVSINVARQTTFAQLAEKLTVLADIHGQLVQPVPYQYCNRSLRYFRLPIVVLCG